MTPQAELHGTGRVSAATVPGQVGTVLFAPSLIGYIPAPRTLWRSAAFWAWTAYALIILAAVPHFVVQYWFNQSLGFRAIFWTNFGVQGAMFEGYGAALFLALWLPIRRYAGSAGLRAAAPQVASWVATLGGWIYAGHYQQALLALHGVPFGQVDPVFGRDVGFYVYLLPFWQLTLRACTVALVVAIVSGLAARFDRLSSDGTLRTAGLTPRVIVGLFVTPPLATCSVLLGLLLAGQTWLGRYGLLLRDNTASGVRVGAEFLDLNGVLSTLNLLYVTAMAELALTVLGAVALRGAYRAAQSRGSGSVTVPAPRLSPRRVLHLAVATLAVELTFFLGVATKDHVVVSPNEPVVQREYIQRHMDATLRGYRLDNVEVREWEPPALPLSPEQLLESRTVQNAPVVSSFVSYLEEPPDRQHFERIAISESKLVYGPVLQVYEQQQQLRPYYKFLSIDGVRYSVDGEKRMYASAVRELPSRAFVGSQEWLRYWGSAALLFTHGMGLVMSPVNGLDDSGNPLFAVKNVPPEVGHPAFAHEPRIYFGEGLKDDYVLTKARHLREFDYPTEQFRQEFSYPDGLPDGIPVRNWFRRAMFAFYTGDVTAFLFSRYIDHARTRVHIRRTPIERARSLAPFLFFDSNVYAFIADAKVLWMINALTTTDRYPYAFREVLGDKADERAIEVVPERIINYAEDAVKITLDAFSGAIRFYKVADDPIANTWQAVYPELFAPGVSMPAPVRSQLTYPLQWFHVQFDDIYKRYHQRDPIEFYNVEDLWDDADETLGSLGRGLSGYGTGDQMTFSYEGYQALIDPVDLPPGVDIGRPGDLQFALMMPFTPDGARNLRSLIIALQDPGSYGRLISLRIPQGSFVPGPEQVDSYIDNDRPVHQQVTMWIRHASEVIRGRTLLLPVRGDLLYVEPIWVSSIQNEMPQLKLFAVRYHDRITSGATLAEAILKRRGVSATALRESSAPTGDPSRSAPR